MGVHYAEADRLEVVRASEVCLFKFLKGVLGGKSADAAASPVAEVAADEIAVDGAAPFPLAAHTHIHNGFPYIDWNAVYAWLQTLPSRQQQHAWLACERTWLLRMRAALGAEHTLSETSESALVASLAPNVARATLEFMGKTLKRIVRVLDGVAQAPAGRDILIVFDDHDSYYAYVSHYYPDAGEFAFSGGMHINTGCRHFITMRSDMHAVEPVIAHEMTHGCVSHLPLPAWLNEGIAVNTEHRLTGSGARLYTPAEMHQKHVEFWGEAEIQEFWSGKSFLRSDDGNMLSYDLARIIVDQTSADWAAFREFALAAHWEDAGARAAREHLNLDLGAYVCSIVAKDFSNAWAPDPAAWDAEPEKGRFSGLAGARARLG